MAAPRAAILHEYLAGVGVFFSTLLGDRGLGLRYPLYLRIASSASASSQREFAGRFQLRDAGTCYRLLYCSAFRARLSPYFLLSLIRESRVRSPCLLSGFLKSSSIITSARAMPCLMAPA